MLRLQCKTILFHNYDEECKQVQKINGNQTSTNKRESKEQGKEKNPSWEETERWFYEYYL